MGQRSRRRARAEVTPAADRPEREPRPKRREAGSRESLSQRRDAAARAALRPLAPGERPRAVTIAAVIAALLAIGNVAAFAAGLKVQHKSPGAGGVILFAGLMLITAGGMWAARYWAVLGFQALLAVTIVIAALSLMVASNLAAVALCVGIIVPGGFLFYKLIRAMARIQMPRREPRS
ncbi:MAG TPA: hypothetical protein VHE14_03125 [Solirubrobacteraceae bacterium]|nr:hypothetical protein [Solirubrobacteraceae bacterium]